MIDEYGKHRHAYNIQGSLEAVIDKTPDCVIVYPFIQINHCITKKNRAMKLRNQKHIHKIGKCFN